MNGGLKIVGLTRVRNEELLIADLLDHLAQWCDEVYVYDDCSTDATLDIIRSFHGIPVHVLRGERWRENRLTEETAHRASLLRAASLAGFDWCLYIDADERLDFDLREHLEREPPTTRAISLRLYDAYLTIDSEPYVDGSIARLPRAYGVEYRDITMVWRGGHARRSWEKISESRRLDSSSESRNAIGELSTLAKRFRTMPGTPSANTTPSIFLSHISPSGRRERAMLYIRCRISVDRWWSGRNCTRKTVSTSRHRERVAQCSVEPK